VIQEKRTTSISENFNAVKQPAATQYILMLELTENILMSGWWNCVAQMVNFIGEHKFASALSPFDSSG
jgi:hypothetical protein